MKVSYPFEKLTVCVATQTLQGEAPGRDAVVYPVSTAAKGTGQQEGSWQTPLGRHRIRARIGDGAASGSVFVRRRLTGEIWTPELHQEFPERDWILTRILWLTGRESGFNRGGDVDSLRRFIYIHGTPEHESMGEPHSHGCVRMTNSDVIELFDRVAIGTRVQIIADTRDQKN